MPHDELSRERQELLAEIEAAFNGVSRDDGITLHEAEAIDNYETPEERRRARDLDVDQRWQEVPAEPMEQHSAAATFLDAKGFRYYLPALMSWCIGNPESDSATCDNLLALLNDPRQQEWCQRDLTPDQKRAVTRFVDLMLREYWVTHDDQSRSLMHYWSRLK